MNNTPLFASASLAIVAGLLVYWCGMTKPLWRSAVIVVCAAAIGYYGHGYLFPCEACEKGGTCPTAVEPSPTKETL